MASVFEVPQRFRGPPTSVNGGYACGAVARFLDGPAEVTLRSPPPLGRPLNVERTGDKVSVFDGSTLVATAQPAEVSRTVPAPVTFAVAQKAAEGYPGFKTHPFPGCFVCGPERKPGDGLCIFPGPVEGRDLAAAPWRPDASVCDEAGLVQIESVWASLDCPSYFGIYPKHRKLPMALLGRLAARIDARPRLNEECFVTVWCDAIDGRKYSVGSALFSEDRGLLAVARGIWIEIKS
jgi:hypothetical protein